MKLSEWKVRNTPLSSVHGSSFRLNLASLRTHSTIGLVYTFKGVFYNTPRRWGKEKHLTRTCFPILFEVQIKSWRSKVPKIEFQSFPRWKKKKKETRLLFFSSFYIQKENCWHEIRSGDGCRSLYSCDVDQLDTLLRLALRHLNLRRLAWCRPI